MRVELPGNEIRIGDDSLVQRNRGLDALHHEPVQRAMHARNGFGAVVPVRDQLGDQRIVVWRDHRVGVRRGIDANARASGNAKRGDAAGAREQRSRDLRR